MRHTRTSSGSSASVIRGLAILAAIALSIAGCAPAVGPSSNGVGATCTASSNCQGTCILGDSHYPGGFCSFTCTSDANCPSGSACVDDNGGMCGASCQTDNDCTAYGRGYRCDQRGRRGASGATGVCRVP